MTHSDGTRNDAGLVASRVVEALIKGRGATINDLAEGVGMTRSTVYNRIKAGDWKFTELAAVAEWLDEPISSFVDGLGGRFLRPVDRSAVVGKRTATKNASSGDTRRSSASELVFAAA